MKTPWIFGTNLNFFFNMRLYRYISIIFLMSMYIYTKLIFTRVNFLETILNYFLMGVGDYILFTFLHLNVNTE